MVRLALAVLAAGASQTTARFAHGGRGSSSNDLIPSPYVEPRDANSAITIAPSAPIVLHPVRNVRRGNTKRGRRAALELQSEDTFYWAGADGTVAELKVEMPGTDENIINLDMIDDMVAEVTCPKNATGQLKLRFSEEADFDNAEDIWQWLNEETDHHFVMVVGPGACGDNEERLLYTATGLVYNDDKETAVLDVQETTWKEAAHTFDLSLGKPVAAKKRLARSYARRGFFGDIGNAVKDAAGSVTDTVSDAAGAVVDTAVDVGGSVADTVTDFADSAIDTTVDFTDSAVDTVVDFAEPVFDTAADVVDTTADVVSDAADTVVDTTEEVVDEGKKAVDKAVDKGKEVVDKAVDKGKEVVDKGKDVVDKAVDKGKEAVDKGKEVVDKAVDKGKEVVDEGKKAVDKAVDKGKEVVDKGKEVVDKAVDKGKEVVDKAGDFVSDATDAVIDTAGDAIDKTGEVLSDAADTVLDAVDSAVNLDLSPEFSIPFATDFSGQSLTFAKDGVEFSATCSECFTKGSFDFQGRFKAQNFQFQEAFVEMSTQGLSAKAVISLKLQGELTDKLLDKSVTIFKVSPAGVSIPGVLTVGPTVSVDLGAEISQVKGAVTVSFGGTASIPASSARLDFLSEDKTTASGWKPKFDAEPFKADAVIEAKAKAFLKVALGLEISAVGKRIPGRMSEWREETRN